MSEPNENADAGDARHPIQVVSKRTGISADVLRAWEKRYAAVEPTRSDTGRRLYSDDDIERLSMLRQLTEAGRRIGDVAELAVDQLVELLEENSGGDSTDVATGEDRPAAAPPAAARPHSEEDRPHLALAREALRSGDQAKLQETLELAVVELSTPVFLHEIGVPLLRDVGIRWRSGDTRFSPERVLSLGMRLLFGGRSTFRLAGPGAPVAIFASCGSERAELESLLAGSAAGIAGWRSLAAPSFERVEELAALAEETRAAWIVLSLCELDETAGWDQRISSLDAALPKDTGLIVLCEEDSSGARLASQSKTRLVHGLGALVAALGAPGA
jgi:DNA-binding transcriptional MerR regulator